MLHQPELHMKFILIINLILIAIHGILLNFATLGAIGLCYSVSRLISLILNLSQIRDLRSNTKRITLLSLRRLLKIHLFWYELKWMKDNVDANLASPTKWELEPEANGDTVVDHLVKSSIDQLRRRFSKSDV